MRRKLKGKRIVSKKDTAINYCHRKEDNNEIVMLLETTTIKIP